MNNIILKTALVLLVVTAPACATKITDEAATVKYLDECRNTAMAVSYTHLLYFGRPNI